MSDICTSIEQSKNLLELGLDPNTSDMYYQKVLPKSDKIEHNPKVGNPVDSLEWYNKGYTAFGKEPLKLEEHCIPAWSVSVLLDLIPSYQSFKSEGKYWYELWIGCWNDSPNYVTGRYVNQLDAAYDMVAYLLENDYIKKK